MSLVLSNILQFPFQNNIPESVFSLEQEAVVLSICSVLSVSPIQAGLDHGAVLIDYVNHNHIFLGVRFPQSPSDLLQIKNLGKRRPCHHQNAEFRIIPSL